MAGTTALPRGRSTLLRLADQTDVSTPATTGFFEVNAYQDAFNKKRPLDDDDVTGFVGFQNITDSRPAAPGLEDADGTTQVPLDLDQIGWWLKGALGNLADAGSADPYTHTFTSGADSLPARTLERKFNASQFESMTGAVVTSLSFPIGAAAGYAKVDVGLWAKQVSDPYPSSIAGSPTVVPLISRVPAAIGIIKANGVQIGRITTGSLKINNDVVADRYAGDTTQSDAFLQGMACAVDMTARYTTDALRNLGKNASGSPLPDVQTIELSYTLSASRKLVITAPAVRFNPVSLAVTNGGLMTQQLSGRAEVGASAPMLTAVLTNARTTY